VFGWRLRVKIARLVQELAIVIATIHGLGLLISRAGRSESKSLVTLMSACLFRRFRYCIPGVLERQCGEVQQVPSSGKLFYHPSRD